MTKLALFDCDGTLIDSQHDIVEAMNRTFEGLALDAPSRALTLSIIGLSLPNAMARLMPHADEAFHLHMAERYRLAFREMRQAGGVREPLYPGIAEVLDELEAAGWLLGVATGKSDRGLQHCLETHGIYNRFITLQTADRHPSKPHPAMAHAAMEQAGTTPETTVMIGDTSFDIQMAHNAGMHAIGVTWGYHSAEELHDAGAHAVVMDISHLARHIGAHDAERSTNPA